METGLFLCAVHDGRHYLHGTRALLRPGHLLAPATSPPWARARSRTRDVYLPSALNTATWEAELAGDEGPARIYCVERRAPSRTIPS